MKKPLQPSTNRATLVKISPLDSELLGLETPPLKNKEKNMGKIYSRALSASLPRGLQMSKRKK